MVFERLRRRASSTTSPPALRSACYAPHSALYLRPDGLVHACCVTGFALGSVTGPDRQSLSEIWQGALLQAQRRELEAGSHELGCQECGVIEWAGGRRATVAYHFDRFAEGAPHRYPKLLDLALSSRCNLQCVMCNGGLSSAIRVKREGLPPLPEAYDDRFFDELEEFLPHVERFQFKGGEPFLARENRRIWDFLIARGLSPEVTITTNGTVYNDNVEHYVRELRMHPNISVDGMDPHTLESIRVGVDAEVLWRNIDRFQMLAEEAGNGMTLSFCVVQSNWRDVAPFLAEVDRRGVNGNVIFVNQPHQFDLLRLPVSELSQVLTEMKAAEPDLVADEPRRVWREVLDRIESQVARPAGEPFAQPVEIVVRSALSLDDAEQASLRAELVERHGLEPLMTIAGEDGSVSSVDAPPWAAWLEPGAFIGRQLDDLSEVIHERLGGVRVEKLPSTRPGVNRFSILIDGSDGARRLESSAFLDDRTRTNRAFVVEVRPGASMA